MELLNHPTMGFLRHDIESATWATPAFKQTGKSSFQPKPRPGIWTERSDALVDLGNSCSRSMDHLVCVYHRVGKEIISKRWDTIFSFNGMIFRFVYMIGAYYLVQRV